MAAKDAALLLTALVACFSCVRCAVLALMGWVSSRAVSRTASRTASPAADHPGGSEHAARGIARSLRDSFARLSGRLLARLDATRLGTVRREAAERRRRSEIRRGMPEMVRLLCIALESGSSPVQALSHAARNCPSPLDAELSRAVWDMESGQGFDEAMERLRTRAGCAEFGYLAVALEIQHQTGSSLADVLESVASSLAGVAELEESLETQTAQGRLSAKVVALMPIALLAVLSLISPGYLTAFFESAAGIALFFLAVLLEAAGAFFVKRALDIDVSASAVGAGS